MVEWKKLGEITRRNKGIPITAGQMSELASKDGNVRVFAAGSTIADIDESRLPKNCAHKLPSIIVKSRGYIDFEFYEKPFTHKNEMWSYSFDNKQEGKFIYYFLTTQTDFFRNIAKANSVKLPQLCVADTDNFSIPIPSLEEQTRIVGILDTFTSAIDNLKEQIAQRKKQYEYYRNQLLTFDKVGGARFDVKWMKLGEICDFQNGFAFKSTLFKTQGAPIIRITNINGNYIDEYDMKYFNVNDYNTDLEQYKVYQGDILIAMSGATTGKIGCSLKNKIYYLNQRVGKFIPHKQLDKRYLFHVLSSKTLYLYYLAGGGAQPNLSSNKLLNDFVIPIPPLEEQQRIVSILDTFEASIQNLESQLKERQKQYEYYRNKLLAFE